MEIEYNKLIRDKIPEIIERAGKKVIVEKVEGEQLLDLLNKKLEEELREYKESGSIEELADMVEIIYGILNYLGISLEDFEVLRQDKNYKRGSFKKGLVLKKVVEDE